MATQQDLDFTYTLIDRIFRLAVAAGASANGIWSEREILGHYRLVFEKV